MRWYSRKKPVSSRKQCPKQWRRPSHEFERNTMEAAIAEFLRFLALEKNASALTVKSYREDLSQATTFFKATYQTSEPAQLNSRHVRAFTAWLHEQGYAKTTIARRVAAVR